MGYYAVELHTHTLHSDGDYELEELLSRAKQSNLQLIAVTDHNTLSAFGALNAELERKYVPVLKGIEWTTFFGHALVLGCDTYVDWRKATPDNIEPYIIDIKKAGGLFGLAHPFDLGSPMCTGGAFEFRINDRSLIDFVEVWHEDFPSIKTANKRAKQYWLSLLDEGRRVPLTYGKDWHNGCFDNSPCAVTYLYSDEAINASSAKQALKIGGTSVSMGGLFVLEVECGGKRLCVGECGGSGKKRVHIEYDGESGSNRWSRFDVVPLKVKLYSENERLVNSFDFEKEICFETDEKVKFLRAELHGKISNVPCEIALTSAIYFD